jgi:hypothetical protein
MVTVGWFGANFQVVPIGAQTAAEQGGLSTMAAKSWPHHSAWRSEWKKETNAQCDQ